MVQSRGQRCTGDPQIGRHLGRTMRCSTSAKTASTGSRRCLCTGFVRCVQVDKQIDFHASSCRDAGLLTMRCDAASRRATPVSTSSSCARLGTGGVCHQRDVRLDEAAAHGVGERGADDDVDVVDGLGREFATGATATGE